MAHFLVRDRPTRIRVREATLDHDMEGKLTNDLFGSAVFGLLIEQRFQIILCGTHGQFLGLMGLGYLILRMTHNTVLSGRPQ